MTMRTLNHTGDEAHQPGARPGLAGTLCPPLLEGPDGDRPEVSRLDGCATSERVLLIQGPGVCISPNTGTENGGVAPGAASRGERSGPRPCHPPSLRGALSPTPVAASGTCAGPPNPSSSENSDDRSLPIRGAYFSVLVSLCKRTHGHHQGVMSTSGPVSWYRHPSLPDILGPKSPSCSTRLFRS